REFKLLGNVRVIVGLGKVGFDSAVNCLTTLGIASFLKRPSFEHGATYRVSEKLTLLGSYHPSQQNTFTGRLTEPMFNSVLRTAKQLVNA
ncbi:MAG: hypothetical protein HW374_2160, partial [Bacteroidetes bacterium]|nr:hypothetical protein [Bacteroidota bacterium]